MADESVNEPHDPVETRLMRLEQQVTDINRNVSLLMAALNRKLWIFGEDGGSNAEDQSERRSEDQGEMKNELKK